MLQRAHEGTAWTRAADRRWACCAAPGPLVHLRHIQVDHGRAVVLRCTAIDGAHDFMRGQPAEVGAAAGRHGSPASWSIAVGARSTSHATVLQHVCTLTCCIRIFFVWLRCTEARLRELLIELGTPHGTCLNPDYFPEVACCHMCKSCALLKETLAIRSCKRARERSCCT
jgi:hypothetical protein